MWHWLNSNIIFLRFLQFFLSKIRTSNKTFKFGFVFQLFDIRLLTAFCRMPLFIFDHDCVDHSICIWSQDGAAVMSCSWLNRIGRCGRWSESALMVVMGNFCWPWPGALGGARDTGDHRQCSVGGHEWEGEMMPTRSRCLCGPTLGGGGRGGPGGQGRLRGSCVFSWPSLREYSHMDMTCGG